MRRLQLIIAVLVASLISSIASAETKVSPEALVAQLYKVHDTEAAPFFQTKKRALLDQYFTKDLAELIWKDSLAAKGEVGAIDFHPLYGAQDPQITEFKLGSGAVSEDKASVKATFKNQGKAQTVTFALVQDAGKAWKVSNITYPDKSSLRQVLTFKY